MDLTPLNRSEMVDAVERRGGRRIPLVMAHWWGEGLAEQYGERLNQLARYPEDAVMVRINPLNFERMKLSWYDPHGQAGKGFDARIVLPDWKYLDEFIEKLPDPEAPGLLDTLLESAHRAHAEDRYLIFMWWSLLFETPWMIRGMENLMMDYYEFPNEIHRLHGALCDLFIGLIRRAARELKPDGFWTSDDLGNQRQLMMKPEHYCEFIKPYYGRIARACHENKMHFWLHSCGNITEILDDLIEVGIDVLHPIQKHTMDETAVSGQFGERITFLAGIDVQHILREATPGQVRAEVRHLIDTFDHPGRGMGLAAGNGIVGGTPFENIEAFLDEAVHYGAIHSLHKGKK